MKVVIELEVDQKKKSQVENTIELLLGIDPEDDSYRSRELDGVDISVNSITITKK